MINLQTKQIQQGNSVSADMANGCEKVVYIGRVTQFELWKAIYDSCLLEKFKLTQSAKLVLLGIARHYNPANEDCYPSYACLCSHLGVSKKSVERAIKELVAVGFITYRTQKVNRYKFTGYFFECAKLTLDGRQIDADDLRQNDALTNNHEKIKKNGYFLKKSSFSECAQETEPRQNQGSFAQNEAGQEKTRICEQVVVVKNTAPAQNSENASSSMQVRNSQGWSYKNTGGRYNSAEVPLRKGVSIPPTDGGSSRVPSVAQTKEYLDSVRSAREENASPRFYNREQARIWYEQVGCKISGTSLAQYVYEKFNGFKPECGEESSTSETRQ